MIAILYAIYICYNLKLPQLDTMFEDESIIQFSGIVTQVTEKEKTHIIYLENPKIQSINQENISPSSYGVKKLLIYYSRVDNLHIGNTVQVYGTIQKFSNGTNPGQFNEFLYYKSNSLDYKVYADTVIQLDTKKDFIKETLRKFRKKISLLYQSLLSDEDAGVVRGMLLGETHSLETSTKELYQKSGISHILAISGLHISMIGLCLYKLLKKLYLPDETSIPLAILVVVLYGIMVNGSVSANRAILMLAITLIGKLLGRTYDLISALCLSGSITLFLQPLQIVNCGFLLSYGAIMGIAYVYPTLKEIIFYKDKKKKPTKKTTSAYIIQILDLQKDLHFTCKSKKLLQLVKSILKKIIDSILISLSVNLMTLPIIIYFYFDLPIYSIFLNLCILPFLSLLLTLIICVALFSFFCFKISLFLVGSIHYILQVYTILCNFFLQLPMSILTIGRPSAIQMFIYYGCLSVFLTIFRLSKNKITFVILLGLLCIFIHPPNKELKITMLDVGQGDGILIENTSGKNYFIDGGSTSVKELGKYRIIPCLKSKGITCIDYAFITHTDQDHISAICEILEQCEQTGSIKIKNLVLPDTTLKDKSYLELVNLAIQKKVHVNYLKKGIQLIDEDLTFTCLHPYEGFQTENRNNYSLVLALQFKNFDMLFTGDVSDEGETALINSSMLKNCEILKVAHHGSRYTNSEKLLDLINPQYSIISAGKRNEYGHPHEELLDRLKNRKIIPYCTIECGAIEINSDGIKYEFKFWKF